MKTIRILKAVMPMLGLLVAVLCAVVAGAQSPIFKAKFTLPYQVQWGKAILPAGEYWLRVEYPNGARMVTVSEAKTGKAVAFVLSPVAELNPKGPSALLISTRGGERIVDSLRLVGLGVTFVYDPRLARGRETVQKARQTQEVPILATKK